MIVNYYFGIFGIAENFPIPIPGIFKKIAGIFGIKRISHPKASFDIDSKAVVSIFEWICHLTQK